MMNEPNTAIGRAKRSCCEFPRAFVASIKGFCVFANYFFRVCMPSTLGRQLAATTSRLRLACATDRK